MPQALIEALRWMTVIPIPRHTQTIRLADIVPWLPLTGLVVGLGVWAAASLGTIYDPWLGAWLGMLAWMVITGFLHADGLADVVDALGASHAVAPEQKQARFLAVLKDPHIGSFGVMGLLLLFSGKLILLYLLAKQGHLWWLIWIPVWARLGILFWIQLPALTQGSAAALQSARPSKRLAIWLGMAMWSLAFISGTYLWLAPAVLWAWHLFLKHHLHGMNGDALGAGVECSELLLLVLILG